MKSKFDKIMTGTIAGCLALGLAGCKGAADEKDREELEAFAKTALGEGEDPETKAAREADEAARKKAFAERKAKEEAEKKQFDETVATYAVLPEDMPKDVDEACKRITEVYTDWIKTQYAEDAGAQMNYFDNKKKILGELRGKCLKIDNLEAAACQANVLAKTPAGMAGKDKELMRACVEKFAPEVFQKIAAEEAALKGKDGAEQPEPDQPG